ncbi:hypothetical protein LZ554_008136 [Drepanopeziza brunnea f. sp. 'monogermtubi']|nr:hypothetical protein LZ554_008136 [Drepanopeziza brunnea f. sp. 'monogermtubi']
MLPTGTLTVSCGRNLWENQGVVTLELRVGGKRKIYSAHAHLLFNASPWLRKQASGIKPEIYNHVILPLDNPNVIEDFMSWLYHGPTALATNLKSRRISDLVDLYLFADKYQCRNVLKNVTMDAIQDVLCISFIRNSKDTKHEATDVMPAEEIERIFASTRASCSNAPLRKFCAATIANLQHRRHQDSRWSLDTIADIFDKSPGLLREYLTLEREQTGTGGVRGGAPYFRYSYVNGVNSHLCYFHTHNPGEECISAPNYIMQSRPT